MRAMITIEEIRKQCGNAFSKAGWDFAQCDIDIVINGRLVSTLGRCCYKYKNGVCVPAKLEFSKLFLETSTDEAIRDVIYHECAHALVMLETHAPHKHDYVFKKMCFRIGTNNDGYSMDTDNKRIVPDNQIYKYFVLCPDCGHTAKYHRAGKVVQHPEWYRCGCCKGDQLQVIQNF